MVPLTIGGAMHHAPSSTSSFSSTTGATVLQTLMYKRKVESNLQQLPERRGIYWQQRKIIINRLFAYIHGNGSFNNCRKYTAATTPIASLPTSTAATTLELLDYFDKAMPEERGTTTTSSAHAATTSSARAASGRKGVGCHKKKNPQPPAALTAHQAWTLQDSTEFEEISVDYQEIFLDELLTI